MFQMTPLALQAHLQAAREIVNDTSSNTLLWLRQRFKDRLISRRCDIELSSHSPDLKNPDVYLWCLFVVVVVVLKD